MSLRKYKLVLLPLVKMSSMFKSTQKAYIGHLLVGLE